MNASSNAGPVTDVTDPRIGTARRACTLFREFLVTTRAGAGGQEHGAGQRVGRAGSDPPSAAPAGEPAATKSHSLYFDFPL